MSNEKNGSGIPPADAATMAAAFSGLGSEAPTTPQQFIEQIWRRMQAAENRLALLEAERSTLSLPIDHEEDDGEKTHDPLPTAQEVVGALRRHNILPRARQRVIATPKLDVPGQQVSVIRRR